MATSIRYYYGTDAQILALTPTSEKWEERAFYYPADKSYFYQVVNGGLKRYGDGVAAGTGITLNDAVIGGVKELIEITEILQIPVNWQYNTYNLSVEGVVHNYGTINIQ